MLDAGVKTTEIEKYIKKNMKVYVAIQQYYLLCLHV